MILLCQAMYTLKDYTNWTSEGKVQLVITLLRYWEQKCEMSKVLYTNKLYLQIIFSLFLQKLQVFSSDTTSIIQKL